MSPIKNSKKFLFSVLSLLSIIGYGVFVFAAPPPGGYTAGSTLDPDCSPGDTDCVVTVTTGGGSSQWDDVVGGINYAGGNVGIGTTTPSTALDVVGTIQGSNLNITGDGVTINAPTNLSASFIYDNSYNYSAYDYVHNYRVYSYKDTIQGRIYSSSYLTLASPSTPAPDTPDNLIVNQTCTDGCNYYADGSVTHNFRVYSYKIVNDQRIFSTSYVTLGSDFADDNSNTNYDVTLSWDPVAGADGYRVLKYDQGYNGFNYDAGYDTANTSIVDDACGNLCYDGNKSSATTTSDIYDDNSTNQYGIELSWDPVAGADGYRVIIYDPMYSGYNYDGGYDTTDTTIIDDACGSVCFNGGLTSVEQTSVYTNVATINGQLTLTGPIVMQGSSIHLDQNRNFGVISDISLLVGTDNIFFGADAGDGVTTVSGSNFIGLQAGQNATDAHHSNFIGLQAGYAATDASYSNFFGYQSGRDAINVVYSNFFGYEAGYGATDARDSNFLGVYAGINAINAEYSNFFGRGAGGNSDNANNSNFFGRGAGGNSDNANNSNFFGFTAGAEADEANNANFFGVGAGYGATNANSSNFFGQYAGNGSINATNSNFFGQSTGYGAINANDSNFFGVNAGFNATDAHHSNFFGYLAGYGAISASYANFFGQQAGQGAVNAGGSNFLGPNAGQDATNASGSNFLGPSAGYGATSASGSNFLGPSAGYGATSASSSNFFGSNAGRSAINAYESNFLGSSAGLGATSANNSNFFGVNAGLNATNASNSIFIGQSAGSGDSVNNSGDVNDFSILIGKSTSTGGFENSIALGGSATNTASNQFMIGSATRPIDTTVWKGSSSTECTLTTGTGISCTSDERLKTNITGLTTDTLDKVLSLKTVTYNWLENPNSPTQIGFLAQDLEQYFPELVATDSVGYKSVYYSQITPVLVEAIREMNLKITAINDSEIENSWRDALIAWFGNVGNGITKLFVKEIETESIKSKDVQADKLCLQDVCVTKDQLQQILNATNTTTPTPQVPSPTVDTPPTDIPPPTEEPSAVEPTPQEQPPTEDVPPETVTE